MQTGKVLRSASLPLYQPVHASRIFGSTTPETLREAVSGGNEITAAKAGLINYRVLLRDDSAHDNWLRVQGKIYDAVKDFNDKSVHIEVTMASSASISEDLRDSMLESAWLIILGLGLTVLYAIVMLANGLAPSRCRFGTSLTAGASVILGTAAGFGTAGAFSDDVRFLSIHLGILLLTLVAGYNAVFQLTRAVDRQLFEGKDGTVAMQNGFEEAGPGFVLTSVLAAILMYMISLSDMQAIESLGIHAGFALAFTLVAVCTIYAPALAINAQKHSEKGVRCLGCLPECCCPCSVSEEEVTSSAADRCTARLAA